MSKVKQETKQVTEPRESAEVVRHNEMQDWFDRWADQFGMRLPDFFGNRLPEFWGASREMAGVMRIEETVDDDGITIRGELPGSDPDKDIEIVIEDGRLCISAERHQKEEKVSDGRSHSEFRYGSYRRSFPLPAGVNDDDIKATYEHGILEVRIPLSHDRSEVTRIPVAKLA